MTRILLGIFALGLFFSQPTFAASFDCSKAQTSVEHAVCDDPVLSRDDEDMAAAYRKMHQGLSETGFKIVRQGQRNWLKYIQRICTPDGRPLTGRYDASGIDCLSGQFAQRVSMLRIVTGSRGYRYYNAESFGVAPDQNFSAQGSFPVGSFESKALRMDGADDLAIRYNRHMREAYPAVYNPDLFGGEIDAIYSITLISDSARLISTEVSDWSYGHGAAHGQSSVYYDHFLTVEKRPLAASDIFADANWLPKLDAIAVAVLKAGTFSDGIWPDLTSVAASVSDPKSWYIGPGELTIQFQSYQVGPYALGAPTVQIPWSMIDALLAPGAHNIIEGF